MAFSMDFIVSETQLEKDLNVTISPLVEFLDKKWTLSIVAASLYVVAIFSGRKLMESRNRLSLTKWLVAWNVMLAVFSVMGTTRMLPDLYHAVRYQSFHESVCTKEWMGVASLRVWSTLFSLSKIVELGDTAFIVLRKQHLMLLHWYHHITVLIYTWYSFTERTSSGRWYITMNYAVHSAMYAYYAFTALKYRAPRWIKMLITLLQLSQMVVGVYIAVYAYRLKQASTSCGITDENMRLSFLMYLSYFLLFVKFFYDAYIRSSPSRSKGLSPSATSNGTHANGHNTSNGHSASNGHASNGHIANGHIANGHLANDQTKKFL